MFDESVLASLTDANQLFDAHEIRERAATKVEEVASAGEREVQSKRDQARQRREDAEALENEANGIENRVREIRANFSAQG